MKDEINSRDNIYNRVRLEKDYYVNSFMLHYKELLNLYELKNNKECYMKRIAQAGKLVEGIDFNQNLLFICNENWSKEIFLRGMSKMPNLCSFYHCNIMELHDIFWGNRRRENVNLADDDLMYTEQDIRQDIFCLFMDVDMYSMASDRVAVSLISSRHDKSMISNKPKYNWVFFRGTYTELKTTKGYSNVLRLFADNKNNGYSVYDLNSKSVNKKVDNITITPKPVSGNSVGASDLSDIY